MVVNKVARDVDAQSRERVQYVVDLPKGAHIHISGICGTGTASVLSLLKQLGFYVTGSDKAFYPPMGDLVRELADEVYEGYRAENLHNAPTLVVIGNALSRGNPEVEEVLRRKLPYASMPEVFSALLIGSREQCGTSVVLSGTHGKTTTTAAVAYILERAGRAPGYFIGGSPKNLSTTVRPTSLDIDAEQRIVVLEGDEYDSAFFAKYSKFHSYRPDIAVVTSLEFDHADIYSSIDDISAEFSRFVARVPADGMILVCDQGEYLEALTESWRKDSSLTSPILCYGEKPQSQYRLISHEPCLLGSGGEALAGQALEFDLSGERIVAKTRLLGRHNALNLLAAAAVCRRLGVSVEDIEAALREFEGVARRQQVAFQQNGIIVLEDFAHHPTAVQSTLAGLRESYPGKRLVAVFEPRSNTSRRSFFQEEYGQAFSAADVAVIKEVADAGGYQGTDAELVPLNITRLLNDVSNSGTTALSFPGVKEIEAYLLEEVREGDLLVLMSNGDFGGLIQSFPQELKKRQAENEL